LGRSEHQQYQQYQTQAYHPVSVLMADLARLQPDGEEAGAKQKHQSQKEEQRSVNDVIHRTRTCHQYRQAQQAKQSDQAGGFMLGLVHKVNNNKEPNGEMFAVLGPLPSKASASDKPLGGKCAR
jgi:hypothetical protein